MPAYFEGNDMARNQTRVDSARGICEKVLLEFDNIMSESPLQNIQNATNHAGHHEDEDVEMAEVAMTRSISSSPRSSYEDRCPSRLQSMLPPSNFGAVIPGQIYRSSYPLEENFGFLKKLKLKSILTLVKEPCPEPYVEFMTECGIQHFQVHIPANKGTVCMTTEQMTRALAVVLERQNHPLLIHCNKGKHRTGCVTGCLRKVLGENLKTVYEEYHTYADPKARIFDEHFIGSFDERTVLWLAREQGFLPQDQPQSPLVVSPLSQTRKVI